MNRRQLGWAGLGLGALAAGVGVGLSRRSEQLATDDPMEAFWALELATPSGAQLPVRSLRGRPLVLNFWATWCPPCVKEMPELNRFAREFSNRGWQVLGVAIDQAEPVRAFLKVTPVGFPVVLAGADGLGWVRRLGNPAGGLPFSVVLSTPGQIVQRKLGATDFDELARWAAPT